MMSVKNHRSQEDLALLHNRTLPPTHPPPPPPPALVQMVKVENRNSKTEYDNLAHKNTPREGEYRCFLLERLAYDDVRKLEF